MPKRKMFDLLKEVNYAEMQNYRPSDFALAFVVFQKMVNQYNPESHDTPILHLKVLDSIQGRKQHVLILCFRGFSKSTLMEYLMLWCACFGSIPGFGEITGIIYVADTMDNGAKTCRKNLEFKYIHSPYLQNMMAKTKFTENEIYFQTKSGGELTIRLYGADTGVRGVRMQGKRPQLAILDDLLTNTSAKSPTIVENINETIYKSVEYALDPTCRKIIFCGTPFNRNDPIVSACESGAWEVSLYPVCQKFPCEESEFIPAWPDRFSYKNVREQYESALLQGVQASFQQEMMLRINADDLRLIQDEDILWYKRADLLAKRGYYNFYITTDFAVTEKQSADFTCLMVWAYSKGKDFFLVDGFLGKVTSDVWMDKLFTLAQEYQPQSVAVETTGQQKGFIPWIRKTMIDTNVWFTFARMDGKNEPGIAPATSKLARFKRIVPRFKAGKIFFPEEMKKTNLMEELLDELSMATEDGLKGHDDCLDNLSQLSYIRVWAPDSEAPAKQVKKENTGKGRKIWGDTTSILEPEIETSYAGYLV